MTPRERAAIGKMLSAFSKFAEPRESQQEILDATIILTESNTSHIADMEASRRCGRLVDVSGGLDGDLEKFKKDHDQFFFINPVVPILDKSRVSVIANSELAGHSEWKSSVYLNEFLLGCGIEDGTLVLPRRADGSLTRFAMGIGHRRKRPVTRRVRSVLEWLAPAIRQGFLNIEKWYALSSDQTLLRRGIEASPEPLAIVAGGRVRVFSQCAEALLGKRQLRQELADAVVRARRAGQFSARVRAPKGHVFNLDLIDISDPAYGPATLVRFAVPNFLNVNAAASSSRSETDASIARGVKLGLTPRQAEVLALLADGGGNREIAYKLGRSEHTVRAHIRAIYEKLGVSNRVEAVNRVRNEYISP